jgi:flavin reductase (DIM6/NTAB) family NADH-FMN oxidoreductase RutF
MALQLITQADILSMEREYRRSFINTIQGYKPVWMVGTKGNNGVENLAIFNSLFHLGAQPPLLGMVSRPPVVPRNTLKNINETGLFSLNFVNEQNYKQAHYTSLNWDEDVSEFDHVELTSEYQEGYDIPLVKESPIQIGLKLSEQFEVSNGCVILIGEIEFIRMDTQLIELNGFVNLQSLNPIVIQGTEEYASVKPFDRVRYKSIK